MLSAALLQAPPDLIFVVARDGTYLDYYAKNPSDLIAPPDQFLGKKLREVLPPQLAHRLMQAIQRTRAGLPPIVVDYELMMPERRFFQARIVYADRTRVLAKVRDVTAIRAAAEARQELAGRLIAAHESERARVARTLDDGVGQSIATLALELGILEVQTEGTARETTRVLRELAARLARELRTLSHDLHPESLRLLGLLRALRSHGKAVAHSRHVIVQVRSRSKAEPKDLATALALFRIAQDGMWNAVIHGAATRVDISVERKHQVWTMTITDNGTGFDPTSPIQRVSLGLSSIEERARLVHGQALFRSQRGRTVLEVIVPDA